MNYKLYTLLALAGISLASCTKDSGGEQPPAGPTFEQGYSVATRADGSGNPEHGDAYTMLSYLESRSGTPMNQMIIPSSTDRNSGRQYGYYAFDANGTAAWPAGTLVPVTVSTSTYKPSAGTNPLTISQTQAQMLGIGTYRTAVIHPAVPVRNTVDTDLGHLAVFELSDNVWASSPDDIDGAKTAAQTPFGIEVTDNGAVHPLPSGLELYPVKAAVKFNFYSEYYADADVGQTTPKTKSFSITSMQLSNLGNNGWYNPRKGIVYPNYNYNSKTSYSSENAGTVPTKSLTATADGSTPGPGKTHLPIQWTATTPVFPSDYRGAEGGGDSHVKPLSLALTLDVAGETKTALAPISMRIESGYTYNFFFNVRSESVDIYYSVTPWTNVDGGSGDIGGNVMPYKTIALTYASSGWEPGGGGNDNIGD